MVLCRPTRPSRTNTQKRCPSHNGDWNTKLGSQEISGVTDKFGLGVQNEARKKASRVLPREHTGHSKHPLPATQETTLLDITRWSIPKSD